MRKYISLGILATLMPTILLADKQDNPVPEIIPKSNIIKCKYNEKNVNTVIDFENAVLNVIFNKGNVDEVSKYLGKTYIQHYPSAEDGPDGLITYLNGLGDKKVFTRVETRKIFACNDYVILENIFYSSKNDLGTAAINTFRVKDGKIIEHWELMEPIPKEAKNNNGIF
ncbi:nuclear transport factor 2 family protein [Francisella sp. SYW-2]|uniref:nuclear transport factor 2 family protein n=1 Tax=Francisella sp. SYW-2 TaxID=2610886 RepID=UPI00123DF362|nr:nuclear transport factor 2 family protein [Francisella sp. SYW-2]